MSKFRVVTQYSNGQTVTSGACSLSNAESLRGAERSKFLHRGFGEIDGGPFKLWRGLEWVTVEIVEV